MSANRPAFGARRRVAPGHDCLIGPGRIDRTITEARGLGRFVAAFDASNGPHARCLQPPRIVPARTSAALCPCVSSSF